MRLNKKMLAVTAVLAVGILAGCGSSASSTSTASSTASSTAASSAASSEAAGEMGDVMPIDVGDLNEIKTGSYKFAASITKVADGQATLSVYGYDAYEKADIDALEVGDVLQTHDQGDTTVTKLKQILTRILVENEYLRSPRADHLQPVLLSAVLERGMRQTEVLPGPFRIARRANALMQDVRQRTDDPLAVLDWVNVYAMAVAEENAAGGRVVTAPTNGAAGVIPAVIEYYLRHVSGSTMEGVRTFLLTAGAVGMLYKENASISGAEVGCQGEVGVACSMAAAGLAAVCGGTVEQIENAAEIGMEHNLGLTCDPVAGQVQIPCIERNAIAAVKAINAARMALRGNGSHYISLDQVIRTMMATGRDMQSKYKETSLGGLAVSIVEC